MRIAVFVEDAAHEALVCALAKQIAADIGVTPEIEVRTAVGGRGTVLTSLHRYVRDIASGQQRFAEILLVAIDANCKGRAAIVREIGRISDGTHYAGRVVCAVPDPHVELWYLADGGAVFRVIGASGRQPDLPAFKCERSRYKTILRDTFRAGHVDPPAGGLEYGEDIAAAMDLELAGRRVDGFGDFIADLRSAIRELSATV